jgi:uncharacterized metal-binding protein YceD (DUF177 family)
MSGWSQSERLPNPGTPERVVNLVADEATRAAIAKRLDLPALPMFEGVVRIRAWLDGAELRGAWKATVTYQCGVSLDRFDQALKGDFMIRVVPAGSRNAPSEDSEISLDPDADEPPDVLEGETIDVAAYLEEHLALEVDPFPRKPGVTFVQPEEPAEKSPFATLSTLRPSGRKPGAGDA